MTRSLIDLAFRLVVEHPPSRMESVTRYIVNKAQAIRRAQTPVRILVTGAGVNVTQEGR